MPRPAVRSWVRAACPFVIVDEAQDLSAVRSRIIQQATTACHVLLAFDEFQCLDPNLRPTPVKPGLHETCASVKLDNCPCTKNSELPQAARAIREGQSVEQDGRTFRVAVTPRNANSVTAYLVTFIA